MQHYKSWLPLQAGDIIDIVAPASRWVDGELQQIQDLLQAWGLKARIPDNVYGNDLLCANSDEQRFLQLSNALADKSSAAVWCLRGGYGVTRLIPQLLQIAPPPQTKLFIGLSDITALHIFLQDKWGWQTLHAPSASQIAAQKIVPEDIAAFKQLIFGQQRQLTYPLVALNKIRADVTAPITGGNLTLVQASIGTPWQIDAADKILFLEEVNERGYRIDRMLVHLTQAGILHKVKAILFGDFIGGLEPDGSSLIAPVLSRFAQQQQVPVYQCPGIGHDSKSAPLPFGRPAEINAPYSIITIK